MAIKTDKPALFLPSAVKVILLLLLMSFGIFYPTSGQLSRYPVNRIAERSPAAKQKNIAARTKQLEPLSLPFWDDFSKPFRVIYPDTTLWEKSFSVWVNDGMAINPPTINVATFDGLDSAGLAYNPNEILLTGFTDSLVSQKINLSETGTRPVTVAERNSVYLSFFYQWGGKGEAPDESDYLHLQFRNNENKWITILTIQPDETFLRDVFYSAITPVEGDQFFHHAFQFRFRSFGRQSGPYDTWNLDYVYLNKGRSINDLSFPDRALATQPGPLFGPYRSMPRTHFRSDQQLTQPTFEIQNLKDVAASINFRTEGFFSSTNFETNSTVTHQAVISKATPINITDNVILGNEHKTIRLDTLPTLNDPQQFPPDADSTLIRLTVLLQTNDNIPFNNSPPVEPDSTGDYTPNYSPVQFTRNDSITTEYILSSYYAYDDGVAEYAAGLVTAGNLVAYEFEMPFDDTFKQDTLVGFDVYFPPYGISSNQTVDFFIYHDENGKPGETPWLRIPARPVSRKGINQFQRFQFLPALLIDEKKFYIGWKEPVAGKLLVGLDIGNDTGDKIFVNTNGFWYQNDVVKGSLMLRPVFGSGLVDIQTGVEERSEFSIYPNPTEGSFYVEGHFDSLEILSITGQKVSFTSEKTDQKTFVQLNQPAGLYILRYTSGTVTKTHKLMVTPR